MAPTNLSKARDIVHVGCDLYAPSRVELKLTDVEYLTADILAVMVLEGRRYVVQELRITRRDGGPPITSELIRGVPVHSLIRGSVSAALQLRIPQPGPGGTTAHTMGLLVLPQKERHRLVKAGPTDETLLWVARVYIMADLAGDPPAKHVRDAFGVPTSTAGYWIRRAKDRKILNG
jgi:hypothetical protein